MFSVYLYVLDTMADWEAGFISAELNSGRFFKKDAPEISFKTVSDSKEIIHTMGGLSVTPDVLVEEMVEGKDSVLLLPGANTWSDPKHAAILKKAGESLSAGATVCAICGATAALAGVGSLDNRKHTSNGPGFLDWAVPTYKGQSFYVDEPAVADDNLITASGTAGLQWAKLIIERLGVFAPETLDAWYKYYSTGESQYFYALMQTLPSN